MILDATPAIEVTDLASAYDDNVILDGVSFKVRPAEIFFIIGGSGCGKTTLLRNLVGLIKPVRGEVRFSGRDFTHADSANRRELLEDLRHALPERGPLDLPHAEREHRPPS
jgi:phospholipid/cholesterol/gamma-HCH transport system ATP-binding protein